MTDDRITTIREDDPRVAQIEMLLRTARWTGMGAEENMPAYLEGKRLLDSLAADLAAADDARAYMEDATLDPENDDPGTLSLKQLAERIFQWGDNAWHQAGLESERAAAAEARATEAETRLAANLALRPSIDGLIEAHEAAVARANTLAEHLGYVLDAVNERTLVTVICSDIDDVMDTLREARAALGEARDD